MKAILVMDMPSGCLLCDLCKTENYDPNYQFDGDKYCGITDLDVDKYYNSEPLSKPDWCPLKSLPNKREIDAGDNLGEMAIKIGWNNCLEKILKEKNNE